MLFVVLIACQPTENDSSKAQSENGNDSTSAIENKLISKKTAPIGWIENDVINLDSLELQKPVLIYFWTTWCKGCKQVEKWYFEEPESKAFLFKNFHLVKINGDSTEIVINEIEYGVSKDQINRHELNLAFSKTWFGYPNILLFDKDLNFQHAIEPQSFMGISAERFVATVDSISSI